MRIDDIKEKVRTWESEPCLTTEEAEYLLSKLEIAEKALEQFTRGKFYRSIENDTWSHMIHMDKEPWKIAAEALQKIRE